MTYNNLFSIAYSVPGCADSETATDEQHYRAVLARLADIMESGEVYEAIGDATDTFEEDEVTSRKRGITAAVRDRIKELVDQLN